MSRKWFWTLVMAFVFGLIFSPLQFAYAAEITIQWNDVENANGYEVYHRTGKETSYRPLIDVGNSTEHTMTLDSANDDISYYFAVKAYNEYGGSDFSEEAGPATMIGAHETPISPVIGIITITYADGKTVVINFSENTITTTLPDGTVTVTNF